MADNKTNEEKAEFYAGLAEKLLPAVTGIIAKAVEDLKAAKARRTPKKKVKK